MTGLLGSGPVAEVLRSDLDAMAVLGSQAEVLGARPDLDALARLPVRGLIITAAADEDADFVSRFFAPATGIAEDAVTGSAHCALAPYWIGRLGRQPLLGRQLSARGGQVRVTQDGASVLLSGPALILSEGSWLVPGLAPLRPRRPACPYRLHPTAAAPNLFVALCITVSTMSSGG